MRTPADVGTVMPGTYIEQVDFRHPSNALDNYLIDPDLKPIRTHEFTLGLDHELSTSISLGARWAHKRFDRTIEDTGVLVPGVGEVYRITNPGEGLGENVLRDFAGCTTCPNQPKPTRNYDGLEFRLRKRLSNNWSLTTSYLYSRLRGNYSGLTSSDENNRNSPSVNRFFDGQYNSFDQNGQPVIRTVCRPIVRTSSKCRAPTTCRGAQASASTGSRRPARRSRRRCPRRASPSSRMVAATSALRRPSLRPTSWCSRPSGSEGSPSISV